MLVVRSLLRTSALSRVFSREMDFVRHTSESDLVEMVQVPWVKFVENSHQSEDPSTGYDRNRPSQIPICPQEGDKGKGEGIQGSDKEYHSSDKGKGSGYQHRGGWEWYNKWT